MNRAWLVLTLCVAACGADDEPTGTSGVGGVPWTTSASGGAAAAGGAGGEGGSSSSLAAGGQTNATGGSGPGGGGHGGAGDAELLLMASGPNGSLGAAYDGASWNTEPLADTSTDALAIGFAGNEGMAVLHAGVPGTGAPLRYATFASGSWSAFADVGAAARAAPSLAGGALAYHGAAPEAFKHFFGLYAGSWSVTAEPLAPPSQPQSFGPSAPRAAALGAETVVAYAGNDGTLYAQTRDANGSWGAAAPIAGSSAQTRPALASLSSGPELLAVWIHHAPQQFDDTKLFWASRTAGAWSAPEKISDMVFTTEAPELTGLANGDALLAFRGGDGKGYTLTWSSGAWSSVLPLNADVLSPPAICRGASGADAEAVYVAGDGSLQHSRFSAASWSAPLSVGGTGLLHAAVAKIP